ncbi:MAG: hypothetical protein Q9M91_03145 [Candidatus Dojkabacteria bacterium]|nr:hypothetical protein [Candidatus Dojkabacteria bacterium]
MIFNLARSLDEDISENELSIAKDQVNKSINNLFFLASNTKKFEELLG